MVDFDQVERIARVCHEANRAYCVTLGDMSHLPWDDAPAWQTNAIREGVMAHLSEEQGLDPRAAHRKWWTRKLEQGWVYGAEKDEEKKTHPCCLPYNELSEDHQRKDLLFGLIVRALR